MAKARKEENGQKRHSREWRSQEVDAKAPASESGLYTNFELSTFDFEPPLSLFRILLNLKLTTDNLKLPKPGRLNPAEDWCHDAGAPGVRSPAWIIAENLESLRSTAGAQCPKN